MRGCKVYHSVWRESVPYEYVRELLGFQKGAPEKVDVTNGLLDGFWNLISG
jgi:hypothetical protein